MYLILLSRLFPTHYINELWSYKISWFILANLFMRMCGHFTLAPSFIGLWMCELRLLDDYILRYLTLITEFLSNMCLEHKFRK